MFHRKFKLGCSRFACIVAVTTMLAPVAAHAEGAAGDAPTHVASAVDHDTSPARPIVGDDPVAIREALQKVHVSTLSPSLRDRVRGAVAGAAGRHGPTNLDLAAVGLDRDVTFVVPVRYGLRYRSRRQLLTLDVDLFDAERDGRDGILLSKVTKGPRGRGLVIAPEAKAKGYVQHVDIIELDAGQGKKTTVRSRMHLSPAEYAQTHGDFALVFSGRLVRPYLTEQTEHADPSIEEPTDISTRISTVHMDLRDVWLVSPSSGVVVSKKLRLSK
ncbi:hypothetical protein CFB44_17255 [Burkholderia sp. AU31280]|uniref:hypothetical protein n=1 Tax=Burkholderia sp. AU31280 TaxID=2015353 RepID=UPI000B79C7FE|nr:hypothetical protein [Burkholderia sp. AU31280]OXI70265.1 hypothetical protein CFB44_17255 [Burkholderia sp. AU31280]